MHPGSLEPLLPKLRPGGCSSRTTRWSTPRRRAGVTSVAVPATRLAEKAGNLWAPA